MHEWIKKQIEEMTIKIEQNKTENVEIEKIIKELETLK
jgi:hypothetical protein